MEKIYGEKTGKTKLIVPYVLIIIFLTNPMKTRKNHNNWCTAVVVLLILSLGACGYWYYSLPSRISPMNDQSKADSISVIWDKHTRQDTVVGKLTALDWSKGTVGNFPYRLRLTITLGFAGDQTSYYFNAEEVTRITVFKQVGKYEQKMPFNELKVGDRIIAIQKINLFRPSDSNLLEFRITKL